MFRRFLLPRLVLLVSVLLVCLSLTGCDNEKVTKENADKIKVGMMEIEVFDILGDPTESKAIPMPKSEITEGSENRSISQSTWKNGDKVILVQFKDGIVLQTEAIGF